MALLELRNDGKEAWCLARVFPARALGAIYLLRDARKQNAPGTASGASSRSVNEHDALS